ncbi:MAG: divalent-cation tolerance protein CutA [Limisphaerales bacterium]
MRASQAFAIALVTAPDLKTGRQLAKTALESRLAACANIVPRIESHYWWRGKLETSGEVLLLFKTARAKLAALEKIILAQHPYDTPEFVVVPLTAGSRRYLGWLADSLRSPKPGAAARRHAWRQKSRRVRARGLQGLVGPVP